MPMIERLEETLTLSDPSIRWMTLNERLTKWLEFGEESIDYDTTIRFREHVALQLLDASAASLS